MKNMLRNTRGGAEKYAEPRMEIIDLNEESIVCESLPIDDDECSEIAELL